MKKLFSIRTLCLVIAVIMIGCVCACTGNGGSGGEGGDTPAEVKGTTETWGRFKTILVPDSMNLTGGNILDSEDPKVLTLKENGNDFHYIMLNIYSLETCQSSVAGTKDYNENAEDVTIEINGVTWTGVAYKYAGMTDAFQMYAQFGDDCVLAGGFYYAYNSAEVQAVLGSITLGAAE